jgi:hypothetical protein
MKCNVYVTAGAEIVISTSKGDVLKSAMQLRDQSKNSFFPLTPWISSHTCPKGGKRGQSMLIVTSIIAAVLTAVFIRLSFLVIGLRRKNKVGLNLGWSLYKLIS